MESRIKKMMFNATFALFRMSRGLLDLTSPLVPLIPMLMIEYPKFKATYISKLGLYICHLLNTETHVYTTMAYIVACDAPQVTLETLEHTIKIRIAQTSSELKDLVCHSEITITGTNDIVDVTRYTSAFFRYFARKNPNISRGDDEILKKAFRPI